MKTPYLTLLGSAAVILGAIAPTLCSADDVLTMPLPGSPPKIESSFGSQPLAFERNVGQADSAVQFIARGPGYQLFLTEREAVMVLPESPDRNADSPVSESGWSGNWRSAAEAKARGMAEGGAVSTPRVLRMRLVGADPSPAIRGDVELRGKANYFLGNEPSRWRTNVSTFAKVCYREVYPGTDLVYYGHEGRLEYDFVLAPGADPSRVALDFEGADRIELDAQGDLIAWVAGRPVRWQKPVVYQEFEGKRQEIAGAYRLQRGSASYQPEASHQIGFELAAYDRSRSLVIDPVLVYSTYLGGSKQDGGYAIATDSRGNAYVVGITQSLDFPTKNPLQPALSGSLAAFVTKLNPAGERLFSTYLGGTYPYGLALDPAGNIYVCGETGEVFPTLNALQPQYAGANTDGFVIKLEAGGKSIIYSTFYGGIGNDFVEGIAADAEGNAYIAGHTSSGDLWVKNAYQPFNAGETDSFYAKILPDGSDLVYASYFGGAGYEGTSGVCMALAQSGTLWIASSCSSPDLATPDAFETSFSTYMVTILARFNAADGSLVAATYLDGGFPYGITVDGAGDVFMGGIFYYVADWPVTLPLVNPLQSKRSDGNDGFVAKFSSDCSSLLFSTYFCGPGDDNVNGLALDSNGNLLLVGETTSRTGFPIANAFQPNLKGTSDAFVAKISFAEVLKVSRVSQTLAFSWPASTTGYQLESVPSIGAGAVWEKVASPPVVVADEQVVTVDIGAGAQFFRLHKL